MRRIFGAVFREANEFGKLLNRDAAEGQVVPRAIKVQENHSVSFYCTIHYIMRL